MSDPIPELRFYRVVRTNPPTRDDFRSVKELGRRLRPDASELQRRIFDGLSVSSTIEGARYTMKRYPRSGTFVAVLEVPDDERFRIEQTTPTMEHFTIWGDAAALIACVIAVIAQEEDR